MLASDVLTPVRDTLGDPTSVVWSDPQLLSYLNQFVNFALGLKPDLGTLRVVVNLVAGIDQVIPADGMQFLDANYAGNGQAVFVTQLEKIKHSKFASFKAMTPVQNVQVVTADPRDPKRFLVFPPSTGSSSTLEILYSQIPTPMLATSSTYTLGPETQDAAYNYVLSMAYRQAATDRMDLAKAKDYYDRSVAWFGLRTQVQMGDAPKEDT